MECLKTEGVVDVFQAIKSARIHRPGVIPNTVGLYLVCVYIMRVALLLLSKDHYVFCYEVLSRYVDDMDIYANFKALV